MSLLLIHFLYQFGIAYLAVVAWLISMPSLSGSR
jgi:hypothetical protein